jgi:hypothetical protein
VPILDRINGTARIQYGIISRSDLLEPAGALHEEEAHREIFFPIKKGVHVASHHEYL